MLRLRFLLLTLTGLALAGFFSDALLQPPVSAQDKEKDQKKEQKKEKKEQKKAPKKQDATPADALHTLPGFKVELLHTSDPATEGSWINMTKDPRGRLLIAGQRGQGNLRVTLVDGKVDKVEKLTLPISEVMGMLCAYDSLYLNGFGPQGFGLYRCKDTKGADQYDDLKFLKALNGAGDHGPHSIILGPDKMLYVLDGNHTPLPEGIAADSPHRNYQEDQLLPRQWDARGHATGILAPGGQVLRTDPDGKKWDLMLAGFRNAYDMAFNADGELFTFDSDMEWDWGMPWYRPTRVNHCTSGDRVRLAGGSGKWPDLLHADSLPLRSSTSDLGRQSVASPSDMERSFRRSIRRRSLFSTGPLAGFSPCS